MMPKLFNSLKKFLRHPTFSTKTTGNGRPSVVAQRAKSEAKRRPCGFNGLMILKNERQMKQPGFSALELIVVMAISVIIMTSLFQIYNQVTRNMIRVERFVFEDTQLLALKNRLGRDLSGMSAIWFTQNEIETKQAEVAGKESPKKESAQDKGKRSNYFYSVNKEGHLDTLTFITTGALQSYGDSQDQFVRVVYQVESDPKHEKMYRLMRKEISTPTENIDESALKAGAFYELVGGIKSINMVYQLIDKAELQKQRKATADKKSATDAGADKDKKPIVRSVKQWGAADIKQDEKKNKKDEAVTQEEQDEQDEKSEDLGGAAVPKFVTMKIVFGAMNEQLEKEYTLDFFVPATVDSVPLGMSAIKKPKKTATPDDKSADKNVENKAAAEKGPQDTNPAGVPGATT